MEAQVAVAKVAKYATSDSGDTLEIIERANGGFSLVLVDGQRSGRAAKTVSNSVARKAISLLAEGARDGVAARAAHDYLYASKRGKVRADLQIISLDLTTNTLVVSRCTDSPVAVSLPGEAVRWLNDPSRPIGFYAGTKPTITEIPVGPGLLVVAFTDGLTHAGSRYGGEPHVERFVESFRAEDDSSRNAQELADHILAEAIRLDRGRPQDDISVVVVYIHPHFPDDSARRMTVRFPIRF